MGRGAAREQAYRKSAYFMIGSVELVADNLGSVHGGEHEEDAWGNWGEKALLEHGGFDDGNGGSDGDGGKGMGGSTEPQKKFWDNVTGLPLIPEKVMDARRDEIECFKKRGVYEKVLRTVCYQRTPC